MLIGVKVFYPEDIDDLEDFSGSFRGCDHFIAYRSIKHPALHPKMVEVVEAVTRKNRQEDEPLLASVLEHAGTHYAVELALHDKQYVPLYAGFLYSNDLQYECFQSIDFMRVVRHWGWCFETYYLLFARWLAGENCSSDVYVLNFRDSLRERLDTPGEIDDFLAALVAFLGSIGYRSDKGESDTWLSGRFQELVREHIYRPCNFVFPENTALAQVLIKRWPEVLEKLQAGELSVEDDSINMTEAENKSFSWDGWSDEDIPEI